MLWTIMYNQNVGVINDLLIKAGILERGWHGFPTPDTTFWAVVGDRTVERNPVLCHYDFGRPSVDSGGNL